MLPPLPERYRCSLCKALFIEAAFPRSNHKRGFSTWCHGCTRAKDREYYRKDSTKIKANVELWRSKNRERTRATNRKSVARNLERAREVKRASAKRRSHIVVANTTRYRARKLKALAAWANQTAIRNIYKIAKQQTLITGIIHTVDHIVPLRSKFVCGLHCESNLQVLPKIVNSQKGNRYWPDMWI